MKVTVSQIDDIDALGEMWLQLEPKAETSYFQSWGWISTWLRALPPGSNPRLFVFDEGGHVIGLAILIGRKVLRHLVFASRALFLHEAGQRQYDFIIEHNGILAKHGHEDDVSKSFVEFMLKEYPGWDEIYISGIRADSFERIAKATKDFDISVRALRESSSKYVDLKSLRDANQDFLATLSSNTRYQIRRSIRKYEESGEIEISAAMTLAEAHEYFDGLKILHQEYWTTKGMSGSFSNPIWERFHRALIDSRFDMGEIQLLRVSAGAKVIGYLYNFVKYGCVSVLQSGFSYESNNALHPGYVTHYFAVEYNLSHGGNAYDFLAGDARYKDSLSDGNRQLFWVVLQRNRLRFVVEERLRNLRRNIRKRLSAGTR